VNRADGISEIEGKAARVAASEPGASFKFVSAICWQLWMPQRFWIQGS